MSRSKKYPIWKQKQDRRSKREANKKVRKTNIENYKGYSLLKNCSILGTFVIGIGILEIKKIT
jgi:hypothetical protein